MRKHRGSALLAALIVIGVLALVTVATLRLASISKAQAVRDARQLSKASCVDASRQYLLSRLQVLGGSPLTELTFDRAIQLDSAITDPANQLHIYTGHVRPIDADAGVPTVPYAVVKTVRGVAASQVTSPKGSRDLSNVIAWSSLGKNYHVIVACTDPVAGDMELEFSFRYGL
jgi:type II secretory pathway pseudopilin PulG